MSIYDFRCWRRFHLVGIVEPDLDPYFHLWAEENPEAYARWCDEADRWIDRMLEGGPKEAGDLPDWRRLADQRPRAGDAS